MKIKAVSGTMLMLLLIGMLTLAFNIQSVESESRTWTVDDDGPADFYTIQEAISAANPGDTILVSKGTYYENVDVNKPLNIKGAGASETIVYASNSKDHVFEVKANYVNITGFTLANASEIAVPHEPWASGILLDHVNNCAIFENVVTNNTEGINVFYSNFNSIQNNMVKRANLFGGIHLLVSSFNILTNNIVIDNVVYGVFFRGQSNNNIFSSNVVSHTTHRPEETGVGTGFCCHGSNNIITNNTICLNERGGIELNGADNNKVIGNLLVSNEYFNIAVSPGIDKLVYNNNTIHHNNFISDKGRQARIWNSLNVWDNGYPPGGNYWSDYNGTDFYSGPYQNVTGSDGIGDTPYVIDDYNRDNYPLVLYTDLNTTFNQLVSMYIELQGNYGLLQTSYDNLQTDYDSMSMSYNSINSSYNELESKQEATITELNNIRNLMYIFIITTIVFIATTIYLAMRKVKVKPELKTT